MRTLACTHRRSCVAVAVKSTAVRAHAFLLACIYAAVFLGNRRCAVSSSREPAPQAWPLPVLACSSFLNRLRFGCCSQVSVAPAPPRRRQACVAMPCPVCALNVALAAGRDSARAFFLTVDLPGKMTWSCRSELVGGTMHDSSGDASSGAALLRCRGGRAPRLRLPGGARQHVLTAIGVCLPVRVLRSIEAAGGGVPSRSSSFASSRKLRIFLLLCIFLLHFFIHSRKLQGSV